METRRGYLSYIWKVEGFMDIQINQLEGLYCIAKFLGMPEKIECSWQKFEELCEDVPEIVMEYLKNEKVVENGSHTIRIDNLNDERYIIPCATRRDDNFMENQLSEKNKSEFINI